MKVQHFPNTRTFTLRPSFQAIKQVARFGYPYKIEVVGLAYETKATTSENTELDHKWFVISENPHVLYSRRFVEQNYDEETL
jgi:hypothetical protein